MSRYTGPKARINRRLGAMLFESSGAARASDRRPNPPGMSLPRGRRSTYGQALAEKQKIKYYYGLGERQLRKLFDKAKRSKGNTGDHLLELCECRLDNVVRRAGFTLTRPQARQGVAHGHFLLNGHRADVPSISVRPGDVIEVKNRKNLVEFYSGLRAQQESQFVDWLSVADDSLAVTVTRLPGPDDISLPVEIGMVIELLSR
jgi:small subunit ribosomal protein S4